MIVWLAQLVFGPHHFKPGTLHRPPPLLERANQGFRGGEGRKQVCISQTRKAAQNQAGAFFIHAWEQDLCINWSPRICALPRMWWKWDWLAEALHGEGRIRAKGLKDGKEMVPCPHRCLPLWGTNRLIPTRHMGGITSLPLLRQEMRLVSLNDPNSPGQLFLKVCCLLAGSPPHRISSRNGYLTVQPPRCLVFLNHITGHGAASLLHVVLDTSSWSVTCRCGCLPHVFLIFVFSSWCCDGMQFWRQFQVGLFA